jgi:glycosyltransferase involved in cell wall biosynthesis
VKIVQVVHRVPPERIAGTELYTLAISRGLRERGYDCRILARSEQGQEHGALASETTDGVPVARLTSLSRRGEGWYPAYDPVIEDRVRRHLVEVAPDVVHVQHWVSLTANLVSVCAELGLPTVVTLHDLAVACPRIDRIRYDRAFCEDALIDAPCLICVERDPWQSDGEVQWELGLRRRMIEEGLRLADRLLVPSRAQKDFLARSLGGAMDRAEVLPHGVPSDLKPPRPERPPSPRGPLRLGHWGHLMWKKGTHLLLEAVRRLPNPDVVEVHLIGEAGDRSYREELEALAGTLRVTFHGPFTTADLERLDLDVAVFPSLCHESHSFVLDEAFQLGIPVIVSNRGALGERVGRAGLTFAPGVAEDLAAQIGRLLAEPGLLDRLAAAIPEAPPRPMVEHLDALERIYQEAAASPRTRSVPSTDAVQILIQKQHQIVAREGAIRSERARLERDLAEAQGAYHALLAEARAYQARLEGDLEQAQGAYHALLAEARAYQARLEGDLEQAQGAYHALLAEARAYQARLEERLAAVERECQALQTRSVEQQSSLAEARRQLAALSAERDDLKRRLDRLRSHPAIRLYLRARARLFGRPDG